MFALIAVMMLGAAPEPPVARVASATAGVRVRESSGTEKPATVGLKLVESDLLKIPVGNFMLLQVLGNEQVVRLDEDLELKVSDIAILRAAKSKRGLVEQLDALVTHDEKKQLNERMTGWSVVTAAVSQPGTSAEKDSEPAAKQKANSASSDEARTRAAPGGGTAASRSASAQAEQAPAAAPAKAAAAAPAPKAQPPPPAPAPAPAPRREPAPAEAPQSEKKKVKSDSATAERFGRAPLTIDPALKQCLNKQVNDLELSARLPGPLEVGYRLVGGKLRLRIQGALPVPACATAWFEEHQPQLAPTGAWQTVVVPLK